jgi:hypothetical protein
MVFLSAVPFRSDFQEGTPKQQKEENFMPLLFPFILYLLFFVPWA